MNVRPLPLLLEPCYRQMLHSVWFVGLCVHLSSYYSTVKCIGHSSSSPNIHPTVAKIYRYQIAVCVLHILYILHLKLAFI